VRYTRSQTRQRLYIGPLIGGQPGPQAKRGKNEGVP
jgi:hypothetical protein